MKSWRDLAERIPSVPRSEPAVGGKGICGRLGGHGRALYESGLTTTEIGDPSRVYASTIGRQLK